MLRANLVLSLRRNLEQFAHLADGTKKRLKGALIWGCPVNAEGMRLKDGERLIVISDMPFGIIRSYKARRRIETMFGCQKSRGFRHEDTDPKRLVPSLRGNAKLLALSAPAFCYALQIGAWRTAQGDGIPFKKTLNRPLKSAFRHGLDYLRELPLNPAEKLQEFMQLPKFLSCT